MNSGVSNEYVPNLPDRYVHGLFCEQVRDELRGSQTFVGVLFSGLLVDTFPVTFPLLAVAAWIVIPVSESIASISGRLHLPGAAPFETGPAPMPQFTEPSLESTRRIAGLTVRMTNIIVTEPGRMWYELIVDGQSWCAAMVRLERASREGAGAADAPLPASARKPRRKSAA